MTVTGLLNNTASGLQLNTFSSSRHGIVDNAVASVVGAHPQGPGQHAWRDLQVTAEEVAQNLPKHNLAVPLSMILARFEKASRHK